MKILVVMVAISFLMLPAMAMVIEEPTESILPLPSIFELKPTAYTDKITIIEKTIMQFKELIGLEPEVTTETVNEINVELDGQVIAVIPSDSKFNGMQVHAYCLEYQYGTDNWYNCEQEMVPV
jgi:hypothetical protein